MHDSKAHKHTHMHVLTRILICGEKKGGRGGNIFLGPIRQVMYADSALHTHANTRTCTLNGERAHIPKYKYPSRFVPAPPDAPTRTLAIPPWPKSVFQETHSTRCGVRVPRAQGVSNTQVPAAPRHLIAHHTHTGTATIPCRSAADPHQTFTAHTCYSWIHIPWTKHTHI